MKRLVMQFEFPDEIDHDEVLEYITDMLYETDAGLTKEITYSILERGNSYEQ